MWRGRVEFLPTHFAIIGEAEEWVQELPNFKICVGTGSPILKFGRICVFFVFFCFRYSEPFHLSPMSVSMSIQISIAPLSHANRKGCDIALSRPK